MTTQKRIIGLHAVKITTSLSRSTVYQLIKDGKFPKPIQIGARRIGFLESEISNWIEARIKASRK